MKFVYETVGHVLLCRDPDYGYSDLFIHNEFGELIPFVLTGSYLHFVSQ